MTTWICNACGWMFLWIRQGSETRPSECPECGSQSIDVMEG